MNSIEVFTIGFTQKTARTFFELLRSSGAKRIVDVRLNNISQLAGFAKKDDLRYFAHEVCDIDYMHLPELAPTKDILDAYKKHRGDWAVYTEKFLKLMEQRRVEDTIPKDILDGGCLLCSEHEPEHCHRSLVIQYLQERWNGTATVKVSHLI
jgi:uncharacterized protein (DUF488 family)